MNTYRVHVIEKQWGGFEADFWTYADGETEAEAIAAVEARWGALHVLVHGAAAADPRGKKIRLEPKKLVVHPANMLQAEVLLKSVLRTGTANNDLNPIKSIGLLDEGAAVLSRLTNASAWWVQTDAPEGMKLMMRRGLEKTMEGDFETDSMRYKATERYDVGFTDWRAVYGTPGV